MVCALVWGIGLRRLVRVCAGGVWRRVAVCLSSRRSRWSSTAFRPCVTPFLCLSVRRPTRPCPGTNPPDRPTGVNYGTGRSGRLRVAPLSCGARGSYFNECVVNNALWFLRAKLYKYFS